MRIDLTMDAGDPARLAAFWKLALGYVDEPAPPPFASREAWLAHHGVPEDEWGDGAWLCDPAGAGPRLSILKVPEAKVAKNRLHMDVRVAAGGSDDEQWARVTSLVARLVDAGGTIVAEIAGHHVVMGDPEGNELCVCRAARPGGGA
ncbi:MAG TPA: VOC family protein [Acidimicrobiales bacterium]|nr:VOC family protein [Acidimicrobiales bacterium]